jgi:hypothetical protein
VSKRALLPRPHTDRECQGHPRHRFCYFKVLLVPADGTMAACRFGEFGMSPWQLYD